MAEVAGGGDGEVKLESMKSKPESVANGNGDVHQNNNVEIKPSPGGNTAGAGNSQTIDNAVSKQANPAGNTFISKFFSYFVIRFRRLSSSYRLYCYKKRPSCQVTNESKRSRFRKASHGAINVLPDSSTSPQPSKI